MSEAFARRRARAVPSAVAWLLAAAVLAAPAPAVAADPPTILTAGIDAQDQLYATWTLGAGTTYEHIDFATVPTPDPLLPEYFADPNFADYDSTRGRGSSYTGSYPVPRDRRYFVKVSALAGEESVPSAIWVIDAAKPVIPGDTAPPSRTPTGMPAIGTPFDGASLVPAGVASTGALKLLAPPKTVGGLLSQGVRVRVACSFACGFSGRLRLGGLTLARSSTGFGTSVTETIVFKPRRGLRSRLRRKPRTRVQLEVEVSPLEGRQRSLTRSFTVKR